MRTLKFSLLLALLSVSVQASAADPAPVDADTAATSPVYREKILIRADTMQLDINTGSSVYRGNVSFTQGTIQLSGDTVTVNSKEGRIKEVRIEGSPARYRDTSIIGHVLAESTNMDYLVTDNQLSMLGAARLEQGDRVVRSQRILYDTEKQLILAGQTASEITDPEQRVNITLTPKKDRTP